MATTKSTFKKGDRVHISHKGQNIHGTVVKGGKRLKVVEDGGKNQWMVDAAICKPSLVPAPKDAPSALDKWGVSGYRTAGGEETVRFEAYITLNGKRVLHASNDGRGGCNNYQNLTGHLYQGGEYAKLEADVKDAMRQFGRKWEFEVVDLWVGWYTDGRAYQTFSDYMAELEADMAKYK